MTQQDTAQGFWMALASYALWGVFPLYFYWLREVSAPEVLAHRVAWSLVLLVVFAPVLQPRRGGEPPTRWRELLRSPKALKACATSGLFLSLNWLLYIWAVGNGLALEGSLGYFINPLVSVALGVIFLGERLNRHQLTAIALAIAGVLYLLVRVGTFPWVALVLAFSFGIYGLLKKRAGLNPFAGLTVETILIAPFALAYLVWLTITGDAQFLKVDWQTDLLLLSAGLVTLVPLLLFLNALPHLRLSTNGLIQYLAPTLQFFVAVYVIKEPFDMDRLIAFAFIWAGLAVFSFDIIRKRRDRRRATA